MQKMMCCMCGCKKHAGYSYHLLISTTECVCPRCKGIMGQIMHPYPVESLK
ncbi:hypothetical protein C8U37_12713 [Trichococcus patagoniensis]|uniref:Uncharacterized protein n=1 Tax=Trichococcus patagoniensis TaxID=382641 RepID=A0A2T5I9Z2_9LACT|nr:hypothetical protein C8U37_12713 [Trichococcus patagoniensis]